MLRNEEQSEKKPKGYKWTEGDKAQLIDLFNNTTYTDEEIGVIMGFTGKQIADKRYRLGLSRPSKKWTDEEIELLKELDADHTNQEMADIMKRSCSQIRSMKCRLGMNAKYKRLTKEQEDEIYAYYHGNPRGCTREVLAKIIGCGTSSIDRFPKRKGFVSNMAEETNKKLGMKLGQLIKDRFANDSEWAEKTKKHLSDTAKEWYKTHEHPRGMLGKHHTKETRERMSINTIKYFKTVPESQRHITIMKAVKTRKQRGYKGTTSNAYSRTKGGERNDLNNQYFRSSWEANIARMFNYLGIEWEYEIKRFYFDGNIDQINVQSYQPDFYLPAFDLWVEVKGWMDEKSKCRLAMFAEQYPDEDLCLIDEAMYYKIEKLYNYIPNWEK